MPSRNSLHHELRPRTFWSFKLTLPTVKNLCIMGFSLALMLPQFAIADSDSEVLGYDSIVNQLNRENERANNSRTKQATVAPPDALDTIWFHGGVGLASYMETINFGGGQSVFVGQKGIVVSGGIDLFSNTWLAEGAVRNFGETEDSTTHVAMKEFDLKLVYHDRLATHLGFHLAGGLSARYMTISRPGQPVADYTTPTSIAAVGVEYMFGDRLSVGFEGSTRNAMISDTVDKSSLDATLRVDLQL